jgi:hypothetical protein
MHTYMRVCIQICIFGCVCVCVCIQLCIQIMYTCTYTYHTYRLEHARTSREAFKRCQKHLYDTTFMYQLPPQTHTSYLIHPSIHPSIYLVYPSIHPSIHLSGLSIHPSIHLSILAIHPIHPSIHPSIHLLSVRNRTCSLTIECVLLL